jgi:CCR4-NOT transcription complex subunit 4
MFLHEPGEQNESFTRQDLSSMNAAGTQQPTDDQGDMDSLQSQPPPQHTQPVAAAMQPEIAPSSPTSSSADGSALPAGANWANNTARRMSRATTTSNASPVVATSLPARSSVDGYNADGESSARSGKDSGSESARPTSSHAKPQSQNKDAAFQNLLKAAFNPEVIFSFSPNGISEEDLKIIAVMPPLWDPKGGAKRRQIKEREANELRKQQEAAEAALQAPPKLDTEEQSEQLEHTEQQGGAGGSLQLGGEPEERQERNFGLGPHSAIQPPSQAFGNLHLGPNYLLGDDMSTASGSTGRGPTPSQAHQQQQQILLQQLRNTGVHQQIGGAHGRQPSRFSFTNDGNLKPGTILKQQASILGQNIAVYNAGQQAPAGGSHVFSSGVQGPPPGLKPTGTPPVSGGGMFGQGYGFTAGYGANTTGRDADKSWDLHRGQRGNQDAGKRELMFSSHVNYPSASMQAPASGHLSYPYGSQPGASAFQEPSVQQKQKKKGKKHRHANTSSSGGGGLVDPVADPSILQARLHQNGGAGMTGQGLYAGQGQGGLPSMYNSAFGGRGAW